ncbi:CapA family protein [Streptomyces ipomoeae]|jgi:poly-gamma-glutamate synthesis protein (capsule biosynthesis protein)|uniref:Bacterial capsule synthesis protein n=2 Tax=Streptomyces ipomoeae TaxID=103232 RepID=L1L010_9ACTN|nr:CapA family protein [Streptomyces ipomoeae]EKX66217.1 bacterial capsule synthesis protein [Streptomyces ipomoeae 91-03]MDX2696919.1 CapA family protein [Streptomyces ipomoeae]MDX2825386.1 CapA family protein [Streptomyces ipomoeae]MDX2842658.1 CapA family protein [Streptomyces ipomoeae]MDX2877117.1 CapA family protein [Streptomyces ipomoeae]
MADGVVTLFVCGDVMLGRGVDQILARPGDPALREDYVRDARSYVRLAESANGPVPAPVEPSWPWGEALRSLDAASPDVRIVNLETAVTGDGEFAPDKAVHYRMHPANLPALTVARPDVCVLANNHVLDFGRAGLTETLDSLTRAGLRAAGAGRDADEAWAPVAVPVPVGGRVLVLAFGMPSSGIPADWAAGADRPGVAYVPDLSPRAAAAVVRRVRQVKRAGDVVVVSVHWGDNWGYHVPREQTRFAHALVDGGVDVVHGHSSHHPRPVELYRDRLVLHGCGDFVDDYEGIPGYEKYRDDLRIAYLVTVAADTGRLTGLRMVPLRARRMRLERAPDEDRAWLRATLDRISDGVHIALEPDGTLLASPRSTGGGT